MRGLYLYCLGRDLSPPPEDLRGVGGESVRIVELAGLESWISSSDRRPDTTLEAIRTHNDVVQAAAGEASALLPVRFGQWSASIDRLEAALAPERAQFDAALDRVAGAVELVATVVDPEPPSDTGGTREAAGPHPTIRGESGKRPAGPGRAYMETLAGRHARSREREREANTVLSAIKEAVNGRIREERIRTPRGPGSIVSVAHLVSCYNVNAYRRALESCRGMFPGLHLLVSGPWPPYSFVE